MGLVLPFSEKWSTRSSMFLSIQNRLLWSTVWFAVNSFGVSRTASCIRSSRGVFEYLRSQIETRPFYWRDRK